MLKAVLFDLDGTLLPMDQDRFVGGYLKLLAKKMRPYGYDPEALIAAIWAGTEAMMRNDGTVTNSAAFWRRFRDFYPALPEAHIALFDEFYAKEFNEAKALCGYDPLAVALVRRLHARGTQVVLATNPLFPRNATENRLRWLGLDPALFAEITTYEDYHYCKPNPAYFTELLQNLGLTPADCLMVGNDAHEDLCAARLGMPVYLSTPCLINKKGHDIELYPQGDFADLGRYLAVWENPPQGTDLEEKSHL